MSSSDSTVDAIRASLRSYLQRTHATLRLRQTREQPAAFDRTSWRQFAELGLHAIALPESQDGLGLGLAEATAICTELGRVLCPEPYVAASLGVARLLAQADGPLAAQLRSRLLQGDLVAGIAWQEAAGELAPAATSTRLAWDNGQGTLHGEKQFCCPGAGVDGWIVLAVEAHGPVLAWVAADAPGVAAATMSRVDTTTTSRLEFEGVAVMASDVLLRGSAAIASLREALAWMRFGQAAELVGGAGRALELTLDHLKTRQQFGVPIGSFQVLKHRAVDAYLATEMARSVLDECVRQAASGGPALEEAAMRAKARALTSATLVGRTGIQCHGAMGFTDECDVGHYFRQALAAGAWLGNAHTLRHAIATTQATAGGHAVQAWTKPFPLDADWDAMSDEDFRAMVQAFAARHCPEHLRHLPRTIGWDEYKPWYLALADQGWAAPAWPKEHGGMALSPAKLVAYYEALEDFGAPRAAEFGITMIGPLLIRHGTEQQKKELLPRILRGEYVWCQGYSEPGAGSDLASLATSARREGDHFIVNGQKIWNGHAHHATHMFMLVRTARRERKQDGISFLLVDLGTPGVTVRTIRDIAGDSKLCEVFFDNVRVPAGNLVGEIDKGWSLAKNLLEFERLHLGSPKQARNALSKLRAVMESRELAHRPDLQTLLAECTLDVQDAAALYRSFEEMFKAGKSMPPSVGMLKIAATETYQKVCTVLTQVMQEWGGVVGGHPHNAGVDGATMLLTSLPSSIYGGSNEIQRNVIAKAVLHLPD